MQCNWGIRDVFDATLMDSNAESAYAESPSHRSWICGAITSEGGASTATKSAEGIWRIYLRRYVTLRLTQYHGVVKTYPIVSWSSHGGIKKFWSG